MELNKPSFLELSYIFNSHLAYGKAMLNENVAIDHTHTHALTHNPERTIIVINYV